MMKIKILFVSALILMVAVLATLSGLMLWQPAVFADEGAALTAAQDARAWHWGYMAAALATGVSSLGASYAVATVGTAAVGALTEKPELLGRLLILVGLAEGIAIYGVIISVLILNGLAGWAARPLSVMR